MAVVGIVPAPGRTPPLHSLLVASPPVADGERWEHGFAWDPSACGLNGGVLAGACSAGTASKTIAASDVANGAFTPFYVWAGVKCTTLDNEDGVYTTRAREALEATQSYLIARELWLGTLAQATPLSNAWLDQAAGLTIVDTGLSLERMIFALEKGLTACAIGRRGMIHIEAGVLDLLVAARLVERTSPGSYSYVTARGTQVVADAGYPGSGPAGAASDANRSWAFATTTVLTRLGSPQTFESVDRSVNTRFVVAETIAAAYFDPCCRLAAEFVLP